MPDYLLLMHGPEDGDDDAWAAYVSDFRRRGVLQGGSAIGGGFCARKTGAPPPLSAHLTGYMRVTAPSLEAARALLAGNPVYEAGGVVEVRELPVTG